MPPLKPFPPLCVTPSPPIITSIIKIYFKFSIVFVVNAITCKQRRNFFSQQIPFLLAFTFLSFPFPFSSRAIPQLLYPFNTNYSRSLRPPYFTWYILQSDHYIRYRQHLFSTVHPPPSFIGLFFFPFLLLFKISLVQKSSKLFIRGTLYCMQYRNKELEIIQENNGL